MTWGGIIGSNGRAKGPVDYELRIEGVEKKIVSAPYLASATKLDGLDRESVGFSESTVPYDAVLKASAPSLRVKERRDKALTNLFAGEGLARRTQLTATLSESATTATVRSTTGWPSSGTIYIGTEAISYSGTTATTFTGLTRGANESKAYRHVANSEQSIFPEVTDRPVTFKGRRAQILAYGDGEISGTVIWRGRLAREPRCQGTEWTLALQHAYDGIKQSWGVEDAPLLMRGFYFPTDAPLEFYIAEAVDSRQSSLNDYWARITLTGFYETVDDVVEALRNAVATASWGDDSGAASPADSWSVERSGDRVLLAVSTPGSGQRFPKLIGGRWHAVPLSGVLAFDEPGGAQHLFPYDFAPIAERYGGLERAGMAPTLQWNSTTESLEPLPDARLVNIPTSITAYWEFNPFPFAISCLFTERGGLDPDGDSAEPGNRIYLARTSALPAEGDRLTVTQVPPYMRGIYVVTGNDATDYYVEVRTARWAEIDERDPAGPHSGWFQLYDYGPSLMTEIKSYIDSGVTTPHDLLNSLATLAPSRAGNTRDPWIVADEFELTGSSGLSTSEVQGTVPANRIRKRYIITGSRDVEELFAESLKFAGLFWRTTTLGKLTWARMGSASFSDRRLRTIDETVTWEGERAEIEPGEDGIVSQVKILTGWDPWEEKFKDPPRLYRDQEAIDRYHPAADNALEVGDIGAYFLSDVDKDQVLRSVFGTLQNYARSLPIATVRVNLRAFDILLGDPVKLTQTVLPDYDQGVRGFTARAGYVVDRDWTRIHEGLGVYRVLLTREVRGYAPSARITSITPVAGLKYDVVVDGFRYSPTSGTKDCEFFEAGFKIVAREFDIATANRQPATVESVTPFTNTIRIEFTTAAPTDWGVGGHTFELAWDDYDTANVVGVGPDQHDYSSIADGDHFLGAANDKAHRWAP